MKGRYYTTDGSLTEEDLRELADEMAIKLGTSMDSKVVLLNRNDIGELIRRYISDISVDDQEAVIWLTWDLIQEGVAIWAE